MYVPYNFFFLSLTGTFTSIVKCQTFPKSRWNLWKRKTKSVITACSNNFTLWLSQSYCVAVQIYLTISYNFAYDYTTKHNHTSIFQFFPPIYPIFFKPLFLSSSVSGYYSQCIPHFMNGSTIFFVCLYLQISTRCFVFFFLFSVVQVCFRFCDHCKDASFLVSNYSNTFHWISVLVTGIK